MQIQEYQKSCFKDYKKDIGYPEDNTYLFGNPINVQVPIETAIGKFMIVGAYPSAKFFAINKILDTPVADNDSPFSNESYFDGNRVRTIPSGKELNEVILQQIGIRRNECWITDLVKVFLFKDGHVNRYKRLNKNNIEENRTKFDKYAQRSISWLEEEIEIANPKLIILLGLEVTKNIFQVSNEVAKEYLNRTLRKKVVKGFERNFVCLPHPGILMKEFDNNPWPKRFKNEIAPRVEKIIGELNIHLN